MNLKKNIHYGHGKVHTFQLDVFETVGFQTFLAENIGGGNVTGEVFSAGFAVSAFNVIC